MWMFGTDFTRVMCADVDLLFGNYFMGFIYRDIDNIIAAGIRLLLVADIAEPVRLKVECQY